MISMISEMLYSEFTNLCIVTWTDDLKESRSVAASFSILRTISMFLKHFWHTPVSLVNMTSFVMLHTSFTIFSLSTERRSFLSKYLLIVVLPSLSTNFCINEKPPTRQEFPSGYTFFRGTANVSFIRGRRHFFFGSKFQALSFGYPRDLSNWRSL